MTEKVRITVLVENTAESPGLLAEHGLACWIEAGSQRVLFDTGQGIALAHNAYRLRISISRADALVLSHGHYDHTGGLADALRGNHPAAIYAHPDAFKPKFARNKDGSFREIGIPYVAVQALERHRDRLVLAETPTRVSDGLMVIDNGSDAPGTILADCSEPFQRHFAEADLVIAKGQGNYETLWGVSKRIYFLLRVKCPVIARDIGCPVGRMVLRRSDARPAADLEGMG